MSLAKTFLHLVDLLTSCKEFFVVESKIRRCLNIIRRIVSCKLIEVDDGRELKKCPLIVSNINKEFFSFVHFLRFLSFNVA